MLWDKRLDLKYMQRVVDEIGGTFYCFATVQECKKSNICDPW